MARPVTARVLHVALIVLLTTAAYAPSLGGGFVSDDGPEVAENPLLRSLAPANLWAIATSFEAHLNYVPLKTLSLAIDQQLWGTGTTGYHVTNLLLHVGCALVIYAMLLRIGEPGAVALLVALLWAVHPVQVESVAWISERKNVLSTLFFLLAFRAYLRFSERPRGRTYALVLVLFVCALLSKINTIVLPAILLAYELVLRRRLRVRDVGATLPLFAVGAVLAWVNLQGNPSHGAYFHGGDLAVTLRTSATVVPRYLGLIALPWRASSYHAVPLRASWLEPAVLGAVIVILALAVATVFLAWRGRAEGFWLAWFGLTLSPMLNLVPFPALMADRYLYVPLLGPLVILVRSARALGRRLPALAPALSVLAGGTAAALAWLAFARVPVWHDEVSLWADWAVHTSYIAGDRPWGPPPRREEKRILHAALERAPGRAALHNNIGAIAFEEGRMADAVAALARARALDPTDPAIALNLGRAYLHASRVDDAVRTLEDAARLEPPSYFAHLNLARAYAQRGDSARAQQQLERARAIRPWGRDSLG